MDARQYANATQRNRQPILAVLLKILPSTGNILEIASGTGEHSIFFAPHLSPRRWIPSEPNPMLRESIMAWQKQFPAANLSPPLDIDVRARSWSIETQATKINAIVNINMIHIAGWDACLGLMAGANRILPSGGILYLYGPFQQNGKHTAPSNAAFDRSLQTSNAAWGVRDIAKVTQVAERENLGLTEIIPMPANNFSLVYLKK